MEPFNVKAHIIQTQTKSRPHEGENYLHQSIAMHNVPVVWNKLSSISKNPNMLQVVATGAYNPPVATALSTFCSKWRN